MRSMAAHIGARRCARARRALSLLLDREAGAADVEVLAVHLGRCASCRKYAAQVSAFTRDLRSSHTQQMWLDIAATTGKENGNG
jgi:predicted anti-sigma-YlaC factor YlaD